MKKEKKDSKFKSLSAKQIKNLIGAGLKESDLGKVEAKSAPTPSKPKQDYSVCQTTIGGCSCYSAQPEI